MAQEDPKQYQNMMAPWETFLPRYRDPQLQVGKNYSNPFNLGANICIPSLLAHLSLPKTVV